MLRRLKHHIQQMVERQANRKITTPEDAESARRYLRTIDGDGRFFVHEGNAFASMEDLYNGLHEMGMKTFIYHANHEKNDFAAWVQGVLGDEVLSQELLVVRSKREAVDVVKHRISELKAML